MGTRINRCYSAQPWLPLVDLSIRDLFMGFLSFIVLCVIAFLLWRISDQMPDVLFRLSEVQKDIAEMRRQGERVDDD